MKLLAFIPALSVLLTGVAAFPSYGDLSKVDYSAFLEKAAQIKGGQELIKRATNNSQTTGFEQRTFHALINPASFKFNPQEQHIDLTSEEHKFIPPGPNDIRGPCPGLNLLANHGYLNRNGVTNLFQGVDAIGKVFGVEADLGLALNAYAVVFNGNILDLTWSIGGPYKSQGLGQVTDLLLGTPVVSMPTTSTREMLRSSVKTTTRPMPITTMSRSTCPTSRTFSTSVTTTRPRTRTYTLPSSCLSTSRTDGISRWRPTRSSSTRHSVDSS